MLRRLVVVAFAVALLAAAIAAGSASSGIPRSPCQMTHALNPCRGSV
jgi:hypothetical protein